MRLTEHESMPVTALATRITDKLTDAQQDAAALALRLRAIAQDYRRAHDDETYLPPAIHGAWGAAGDLSDTLRGVRGLAFTIAALTEEISPLLAEELQEALDGTAVLQPTRATETALDTLIVAAGHYALAAEYGTQDEAKASKRALDAARTEVYATGAEA